MFSIGLNGGIHEGNDWATAFIVFFPFGQDVALRKLTAFSKDPWVGFPKFVRQVRDENGDHVVRMLVTVVKTAGSRQVLSIAWW